MLPPLCCVSPSSEKLLPRCMPPYVTIIAGMHIRQVIKLQELPDHSSRVSVPLYRCTAVDYNCRSRSPGVRYGMPPPGRTPPRVGTQLFVAGINFICNEQDLERKFSRYGRVKEARVVRNPITGESRGFAFVAMSSETEAADAIRDMNDREWNGRRLLVQIARNPR
ncbi:hypothetical protein Vafri_3554 [Volvox africanus]|uniref:RRM domain-containing protein n=1 Tax=Volvox africanus TaxID=51714 RepID=A0A8J4ETT0_9CHLO|nr:hypothetical protein Vafri_3554 [Volvox africanus]